MPYSKIRKKKLSSLVVDIVQEFLVSEVRQEKEIKSIQTGKNKGKLSLIQDYDFQCENS